MADPILRACPNCGGTDRYKDGKCKACVRARVNSYSERHRDSKREYCRQWRLENIDRVREADRLRSAYFRRTEPEKRKAIYTEYVRRNPEKVKASKRTWKKSNPDAVREAKSTRRARMAGVCSEKLPRGTIKKLQLLQKGRCACCRIQLNGVFHVDHIQALANGGKHEARNLQLLCPPCNLAKHAKDSIDFMQSRGFLL